MFKACSTSTASPRGLHSGVGVGAHGVGGGARGVGGGPRGVGVGAHGEGVGADGVGVDARQRPEGVLRVSFMTTAMERQPNKGGGVKYLKD